MKDTIFKEFYEHIRHIWSFPFIAYLVGVIIVLGGAGIWLPLLKELKGGIAAMPDNLMTYSCALIAPSAISLLLSILKYKHKVSLVLFVILVLISVFLFVGYSVWASNSMCWSILCSILAVVFWVLANYDNVELDDNKFNEDVKSKVAQNQINWG